MSGYGPPAATPPSGPPPSGPPPSGPPASAPVKPELFAYLAGGLGVLGFVWGFLDWYSQDGSNGGVPGYSILGGGATAIIGLTLVAGLLAAAAAFEKRPPALAPVALAVAAVLLCVGVLIRKGDGVGIDIGLILALITTIVQAGVLGYAWALATGRVVGPGTHHSSAAPNYVGPQGFQGPQGPPPGTPPGPPPGQWSQPQSGQFGPPPGRPPAPQGPPQQPQGPPPGQAQRPPQHASPNPGYGPPPGGYAPPDTYGPPQGQPQVQPQGQPQSPPSGEPEAWPPPARH